MSSDFSYHFILSYNDYTSRPTLLTFELLLSFLLILALFTFWLYPGGLAWTLQKAQSKPKTDIPGPSGLPLLGLLLAFTGSSTHRVLSKLSQSFKATTLMAFSVGFTRFIVSSHPESAKEILNSPAFADRPVKESAYELLFHEAIGFASYGEYWRLLRRISALHLFSPKRIACFGEERRKLGLRMVQEIANLMEENNGVVEVRKVLHFGSLNNVMMNVFGKCYELKGHSSIRTERRIEIETDTERKVVRCISETDISGRNSFLEFNGGGVCENGDELEEMVREGYELLGIFNWSDHFPILGWLDLQGVRRRCRKLAARVSVFVGKIVDEHRLKRAKNGGGFVVNDENSGDFVDVLLDFEKENKLTDSEIIAILWEMIFRGTDTVAILLEWILARMVLHPEIQAKAQSEIDAVTGPHHRTVCDADLPKLHYLQAIVKETLRMHPPGPLLSWARLAIHDTHIGQNFIPAGTIAMVNMWSITHDEKFWPEPENFSPERFMEEDVSITGSDLRLAPFGSGRRSCPGKAMGLATGCSVIAEL